MAPPLRLGTVLGAALITTLLGCAAPHVTPAPQKITVTGASTAELTTARCDDSRPAGLDITLAGDGGATTRVAIRNGRLANLDFSDVSGFRLTSRRPSSGDLTYDDGRLSLNRLAISGTHDGRPEEVVLSGSITCSGTRKE
jgi:hypothetical protein